MGLPGEDSAGALGELLSRIDNVEGFLRDEKWVHEARLIAVMIQRAGVEPLPSGTAPSLILVGCGGTGWRDDWDSFVVEYGL